MLTRRGLFLLLLVLLIPGANAAVCLDWWHAEARPGEVVFETGIRYSGTDASDDRASIDSSVGNGDGIVTPAEVRVFEERWSWAGAPLDAACAARFSFLTQDGATPHASERVEKHMVDASGAVRTDPYWYRMRLVMTYPADAPVAVVAASVPTVAGFRDAFGCATGMHTDWWADHICGARSEDGVPGPRHYAYRAHAGGRIDAASVQPAPFARFWDGAGLVAHGQDMPAFQAEAVSFRVGADDPSWPPGLVALVASAGLAGLAAAGYAWNRWHVRLLSLLGGLPLFSRIERDEALEHPRRRIVLAAIEENPGIPFNALLRLTEIPKGALAHHVRTLERVGLVVSRRIGRNTRFFVVGASTVDVPISARQEEILAALADGASSAAEVGARLGLERRAAQYHLDRLVAVGALGARQERGRRRYHLPR